MTDISVGLDASEFSEGQNKLRSSLNEIIKDIEKFNKAFESTRSVFKEQNANSKAAAHELRILNQNIHAIGIGLKNLGVPIAGLSRSLLQGAVAAKAKAKQLEEVKATSKGFKYVVAELEVATENLTDAQLKSIKAAKDLALTEKHASQNVVNLTQARLNETRVEKEQAQIRKLASQQRKADAKLVSDAEEAALRKEVLELRKASMAAKELRDARKANASEASTLALQTERLAKATLHGVRADKLKIDSAYKVLQSNASIRASDALTARRAQASINDRMLATAKAASLAEQAAQRKARANQIVVSTNIALQKAAQNTALHMYRMEKAAISLAAQKDRLANSSKRAAADMRVFNNNLISGQSIMRSLIGTAYQLTAGFSAFIAIRKGVETLSEFSERMAELRAVTRATAGEMIVAEKRIREFGANSRFGALGAAEAMVELARAGLDIQSSLETLKPVMDLAIVGQLTLAKSAEQTINTMRQFGLQNDEAARVANVLTYTADQTTTNVQKLGTAMRYVGPIANSLGISLETTAAALGIGAQAGLQASIGGTGLRGVLASLADQSISAEQALAKLGVSGDRVKQQLGDLAKVMSELDAKGLEAGDAFSIVERRQATMLLTLVKLSPEFRKLADAMVTEIGNRAADSAEIIDTSLKGAFGRLTAAAEEFALATGDRGANAVLRDFTENARSTILVLAGMGHQVKENRVGIEVLIQGMKAFIATTATLAGSLLLTKWIAYTGILADIPKLFLHIQKAHGIHIATMGVIRLVYANVTAAIAAAVVAWKAQAATQGVVIATTNSLTAATLGLFRIMKLNPFVALATAAAAVASAYFFLRDATNELELKTKDILNRYGDLSAYTKDVINANHKLARSFAEVSESIKETLQFEAFQVKVRALHHSVEEFRAELIQLREVGAAPGTFLSEFTDETVTDLLRQLEGTDYKQAFADALAKAKEMQMLREKFFTAQPGELLGDPNKLLIDAEAQLVGVLEQAYDSLAAKIDAATKVKEEAVAVTEDLISVDEDAVKSLVELEQSLIDQLNAVQQLSMESSDYLQILEVMRTAEKANTEESRARALVIRELILALSQLKREEKLIAQLQGVKNEIALYEKSGEARKRYAKIQELQIAYTKAQTDEEKRLISQIIQHTVQLEMLIEKEKQSEESEERRVKLIREQAQELERLAESQQNFTDEIRDGLEAMELEAGIIDRFGIAYENQKVKLKLMQDAREDGIALSQRELDALGEYDRLLRETLDWKQFGNNIGQAFGRFTEEAIIAADSLRDVAGALYQDLQRIFLQKFVTRPLEEYVSGLTAKLFANLATGDSLDAAKESAQQALATMQQQTEITRDRATTLLASITPSWVTISNNMLSAATLMQGSGLLSLSGASLGIAGDALGSGPLSGPAQSYMGRAFSSQGEITMMAKGGLVDSYGVMQVGHTKRRTSIAEKAPEFIMPAKRMANGELGVVASGGKGGDSYVFNFPNVTDHDTFKKSTRQMVDFAKRSTRRF